MREYLYSLTTDKRRTALDLIFKSFLLLGSFFYHFGVNFILFLYRSGILKVYRLNSRVISIGNITWGGTGKTPIVEMLTKRLAEQGRKAAVLTRGYGEDEYRLLKSKLSDVPILVGKNRLSSGRIAADRHKVDAVILDDGFQYWKMKRDLEIVVINSLNPFGNGYLIPRGILREGLAGLKRARLFFLSKTDLTGRKKLEKLNKTLREINPDALIVESIHKPLYLYELAGGRRLGLEELKDEKVGILSGIGDPFSFQKTVESLGAKVVYKLDFPDHHQYREGDLKDVVEHCRDSGIKTVITTEKDSVKLRGIIKKLEATGYELQAKFLSLVIQLEIKQGQDSLDRALEEIFSSKKSVLVLDDGRPGHLKQSLAVAGFIDRSILQTEKVGYKNRFFRTLLTISAFFASRSCRRCMRCLRLCLDRDCYLALEKIREKIDVVISAGSGLVPVNLILTRANEARNIVLMKPGLWSFKRFTLVIVPEHDRPVRRGNVLLTRGAPNLINQDYLREQGERFKKRFGLSRDLSISLFIGGESPEYSLSVNRVSKVLEGVVEAADSLDAEILVTTSRRTSREVSRYLKDSLADRERCKLMLIANEENIPQAVEGMLALSQIVIVSYDSISMISEALAAARYVIVFELESKIPLGWRCKHRQLIGNLAREGYLTVVSPWQLNDTIKKVWKEKRTVKVLEDNLVVKKAVAEIIR
jgi:tetraacyldisaccharide 4'-kinase